MGSKNSLLDAFKRAENNTFLSGYDIRKSSYYQSIKKRLLDNTITFDEARAEIAAFFKKDSPP
jgi:hypothetical protein